MKSGGEPRRITWGKGIPGSRCRGPEEGACQIVPDTARDQSSWSRTSEGYAVGVKDREMVGGGTDYVGLCRPV